jgi:hypothetical protein
MTKLLDLLEVYLQNRVLPNGKAMGYRWVGEVQAAGGRCLE